MSTVICVFDIGTDLNLVRAVVQDPSLLNSVRQQGMAEDENTFYNKPTGSRFITLHLRIADSRASLTFGVVERLAIPVFLGKSFIDRNIKSAHTVEQNIVRSRSPPVSILMVEEVWGVAGT